MRIIIRFNRLSCRLGLVGLMWIGSFLDAQAIPKYEPFDWVLFRQIGAIRSISEGFTHVYFASDNGGIIRYHTYRRAFDDPITTTQGLSSNQIRAVHYDQGTGILWAATDRTLEFSYSNEGDWTHRFWSELGLHPEATIRRIGNTDQSLWVEAGAQFLKLDRGSGILLGVYSNPTEPRIQWSPGNMYLEQLPQFITNYSVTGSWLVNPSYFVDPYGRSVRVTTFFTGSHNTTWVGLEDGTIFLGDGQLEMFNPLTFGLANTDVQAMESNTGVWIVGRKGQWTRGFTRMNINYLEFEHIDYEVTINLTPQSYYSVLDRGDEIWFGGRDGVLIYDQKKDYWRLYDQTYTGVQGPLWNLSEDSGYVWLASPEGVSRINQSTRRYQPVGFEKNLATWTIEDVTTFQNKTWIAAQYQLFVWNDSTQSFHPFFEEGITTKIADRIDFLSRTWDLEVSADTLFVASNQGILSYAGDTKLWDVEMEPNLFGSQPVHSMVVTPGFLFLGTDEGLIRYNRALKTRQTYRYEYIGSVRDMILSGDYLWMGTNNGLLKFYWVRDP